VGLVTETIIKEVLWKVERVGEELEKHSSQFLVQSHCSEDTMFTSLHFCIWCAEYMRSVEEAACPFQKLFSNYIFHVTAVLLGRDKTAIQSTSGRAKIDVLVVQL